MAGGISTHTRRRLWLRAGGVCAFPSCGRELIESIDDSEDTIVGKECHIVSQRDDPTRVARSVSSLTRHEKEEFRHLIEDRHGFRNLVLMCGVCSDIIDDPNGTYRVADVVEIKRAHEAAQDERRGGELSEDQKALLQYAAIVDEWEARVDLDGWRGWMGGVFSDGHPRMKADAFQRLRDTREWLFSRVLPGTAPELEAALDNFRVVAQDLQVVLEQYPHEVLARQGWIAPTRFYNDANWIRQVEDHRVLGEMYEWYAYLLEDLALEMARAANLVCAAVRHTIDPRYRIDEGLVVVESGPYEDLMFRVHRPQYNAEDGWHPYPGLRPFLEQRRERDEHRGEGPPPEGLRLPGDSFFP